jgi:hypothetical protein
VEPGPPADVVPSARACGTAVVLAFSRVGSRAGFNMSLLISILITFLVVILVLYLVNMLPIDDRARQIVRVVVIVIGVLSLLRYLSVF